MKKRIVIVMFLLVILCITAASGCDKKENEQSISSNDIETVELLLWGAKEDEVLLNKIIQTFQQEYQGQANFQITFQEQGETECKDTILGGLEESADVFTFADDQLSALAAAGALNPIENADSIKQMNLSTAVEAATVRDTLYAYPLTADNGYFLYYNKRYFSDEDIQALDTILDIAANNGNFFCMDWSSAWYIYSFFGNTNMKIGLNEDGITNYCTWNDKEGDICGVDVAKAMLNIAMKPAFLNRTDEEFLEGVRNGTVIAGVSGVWNAVAIKEVWGEDMGAAKLPTYTCNDRQIQMASFSGCKLIGVNAYSKHYDWACKLAEWITNEQNQKLRFELREQGPSNIQAASSMEVQQSPAIAALLEQSEFSQLQRVGGKFWDPVAAFGENIASGNATGEDLQEQLDKMVKNITER
ncbi:extracellular solute-binding protein [Clostridium sp. MD294]|uniref:extracellular solute-binding protein n=1 Tax=Clostridium sp. MD294 TaxID=97138 RepID=UPI0002CC8F59|nr:extracellular solute-binding protein [Clostridium sp. MD294]NDO45510.1 extracellular solute-binding protein [Clostridium sp. MD294]USF30838.1 Cyclodextrin-binding protein [Clostridium sp. MD294]